MKKLIILFALITGLILIETSNVFATDYNYTSGTQNVDLLAGTYTIEAWGSQGANNNNVIMGGGDWGADVYGGAGGKGGYAKGTLTLASPATIYIYGSGGTSEVRLNTNLSVNNLLVGGVGGDGEDPWWDDDWLIWWEGATGTPGTGLTYAPLTSTSTSSDVNIGTGFVRIITLSLNQNPVMSISTPITSTNYSAQIGYKTIEITGKVSDPDANNVTVSATINGKTKSTIVNSVPIAPPESSNFTLSWDVAVDSLEEGIYSSISLSANDGSGGTTSVTLTPSIIVDNTAPTVSAPTESHTSTSITATASAIDTTTSLQYLFNIGGVDQETWQSNSVYIFVGLTASTTYVIKYKAKDGVGNISSYSTALNVATAEPGPQASAVTITEVRDLANNDNASDIRIIFKGATNESNIASYKIIVATGAIDEATTSGLATTRYMAVPKKGNLRLYLTCLPTTLQTSSGASINVAGGSYNVYVLSVGKTGYSDKLSASLSISLTINNAGKKVIAPTPIVADVKNNGNGTDLKVSIRKSISEVNITSYRIIVSTTVLTLSAAQNVPLEGYTEFIPTTKGISYVVPMGATQKDNGGTTAIKNDTAYKVYVLVIGKNGYANVLSSPSRSITLSQYIPGVSAVRGLKVTKVGIGHGSSNICVSFVEPAAISNVQEYRVFIASSGTILTQTVAEGILNTDLYQSIAVTESGFVHNITLNSGINVYDGSALAAATYKIYVLSVGRDGFGSKVSIASKTVTLD